MEMEDSREETEVEGPGQDERKRSPEVLIVEDVTVNLNSFWDRHKSAQ